MPIHWTKVQPVTSTAIVSQAYTFQPGEFPQAGPELNTTGRPRALIGWNHQNDTPDGVMTGQLYTSVNGEALMIYDTSGNRSPNPGEVVFCGLANFTMIRMFHPYFATAGPGGSIPRDMAWGEHTDKENLRSLYHEFLRNYCGKSATGEYIYQIPPPRKRTVKDTTANAENDTEGDASATKPKEKKQRKPRVPKVPKAQRAPQKRANPFSNENPMTSPPSLRHLAAEDDGESLKSETRSMFTIDLEMPILHTSPGNTLTNPIDLIDFEGLRKKMDRQAMTGAGAVDLSGSDDSAEAQDDTTPFANLLDDYMDADPEEEERLLTSWSARRGLSAQGGPVQSRESGSAAAGQAELASSETESAEETPTSSALSGGNDDDLPSVENDNDNNDRQEQDAQIQTLTGKSMTTVVDDDLEMIDPVNTAMIDFIDAAVDDIKADDDDEIAVVAGRTDGLTLEDPIVLD